VTEFKSRRELRDAERQGLVPKPEQVFDLPTGQIKLPESPSQVAPESQDVASVNEMLTRKRIREMERLGLLDPLTGALQMPATPVAEFRNYDSILAETEEPITASINLVAASAPVPPSDELPSGPIAARVANLASTPAASSEPTSDRAAARSSVHSQMTSNHSVAPTDIFHEMAVDLNTKKPRVGIILALILVVVAGLAAAAYMLGIFK
jgi:hypothetical protein